MVAERRYSCRSYPDYSEADARLAELVRLADEVIVELAGQACDAKTARLAVAGRDCFALVRRRLVGRGAAAA